MVANNNVRASGRTTAEEVTREESAELLERPAPELPEERERKFQTPGFSRIRIHWNSAEAHTVRAMHQAIQREIDANFADAFGIMYEIYDLVRDVVVDAQGDPVPDADGLPQWERTATGSYREDWSRLTYKQRERFLFQLTTRLFIWEQQATEGWAESMFSKANWEEAFAEGFESIKGSATVDARNARGKIEAREQYYLAIFRTYYSRKADAIVRSMNLLAQRLKDVHIVNGGGR